MITCIHIILLILGVLVLILAFVTSKLEDKHCKNVLLKHIVCYALVIHLIEVFFIYFHG